MFWDASANPRERLATLLIGPADCSDDVNQTLCHLDMHEKFWEGAEWVAGTAAMAVLPEIGLTELTAGGTSYAAMLEAVQADVRYARVLENIAASQQARMASNFGR